MHKVIEPKILYWGTPVVLVSTLNEDGSTNLAPISSAWWLSWSCMLGMSTRSQTVKNLQRQQQCVLNLPSANQVDAVDRLALLTGRNPVPEYKAKIGYRYEPNKFEAAMLTPAASDLVEPPRVMECPVQLEAQVENIHPIGDADQHLASIEVRILRVHVEESLLIPGKDHYIDPDQWNPLIMSFCEFYGLAGRLRHSKLANAFALPHAAQDVVASAT